MKKLIYVSLVIATAIGGVFTVTDKTQNAEEAKAAYRLMDMQGKCHPTPWDCVPSMIITDDEKR